jgi:hypothetical protein
VVGEEKAEEKKRLDIRKVSYPELDGICAMQSTTILSGGTDDLVSDGVVVVVRWCGVKIQ